MAKKYDRIINIAVAALGAATLVVTAVIGVVFGKPGALFNVALPGEARNAQPRSAEPSPDFELSAKPSATVNSDPTVQAAPDEKTLTLQAPPIGKPASPTPKTGDRDLVRTSPVEAAVAETAPYRSPRVALAIENSAKGIEASKKAHEIARLANDRHALAQRAQKAAREGLPFDGFGISNIVYNGKPGRFEGAISDGKPSGFGVVVFEGTNVSCGYWNDNVPEGVLCIHFGGSIRVDIDASSSEYARVSYPDGRGTYYGAISPDDGWLYGVWYFKDGRTLAGQFKYGDDDLSNFWPTGNGRMDASGPIILWGDFIRAVPSGEGRVVYSDGRTTEGRWGIEVLP